MAESLRPLRISVCPESKLSECERLYDENIPHGVPADHRSEYSSILRSDRLLTLIAEDGDEVVGTFGVQYGEQVRTYWLCYMLVSPEHHRRGIGTSMFFASIALLPDDNPHLTMGICALPDARDFYKRLGFRRVGDVQVSGGDVQQVGVLYLWRRQAKPVRAWLLDAGAELPAPGYEIPTAKVTPPPAPSEEKPTRPPSLQ